MIITLITVVAIVMATLLYMRANKFGKNPDGARLERIMQSPNFKDGKFQNLSKTPVLAEGHTYFEVMYNTYVKRNPERYPTDIIPSVKTDLLNLPIDSNVLVWFGHSSYFMQIDGKRILVDPVFSGNASPLPGTLKSFKGTDVYTVAKLTELNKSYNFPLVTPIIGEIVNLKDTTQQFKQWWVDLN